ncbi:MAG: ABC transporter permease [Nitrospinaceae bacterium]|jgi:peptide/nickel transport system permease protein|nr:ABC transporter permease [Nitrospinaceae bacterium]MBT3435825.1 ABC transporter permease [Nitrospinaceae bacterium]MBT4094122.1 ABC transporter permease [Nitrospinaceae bacterium]MBT4431641.1 ABC transporter permease [Nitrospinaceae bacterium]MBT5369337.1 ABC transporter permease [Nitrospinaceae bacterium]
MAGLIFRRFIQSIVLIKCVLIFVFLLVHLSGDPVRIMMPDDSTEEDIARVRHEMGLDKPLYTQYVIFFKGVVLRGDFGESFEHGESALKVVLEHLPATVELATTAFLISIFIGLPLGCLAALREGTVYDKSLMIAAVLGQAVPDFWFGLMMILFFSVKLNWFPPFGYGNLDHLVMPAITASLFHLARLARLMRSEMIEVLRQDYVLTARSKGLTENVVLFKHALKNSAIPIVTVLGIDLALTLGGTVITETVFAWPGVGRLTVAAIHHRDYPIVQATVFLLASIFVIINMLVDILYTYLDPRIQHR